MAKLRVGLLFCGGSVEHEVSLASATSFLQALSSDRYQMLLIRVELQGRWQLGVAAT